MKHAWKKLLAAAVLPCLLAGCGALGGPESEVPSMDHLLGLTQEQRLEDYDYLVQTLGAISAWVSETGTTRRTRRRPSSRHTGR